MSKRWGTRGNHSKRAAWMTLAVIIIGLPPLTHAAEAPGALTLIVRDQNTDRPLAGVQVTITERETNATQTVGTDGQGRIVVDQLDPGLYAISLSRTGFASFGESDTHPSDRSRR